MIPRYTREEMAKIWTPENKFRIWLDVEAYACEAQEKLGVIPAGTAKAVWERGNFDVARIDEIEAEVKHDVIAFLTNLAEYVGEEARFVHQGMTSSDVLDTAFSMQLKQSAEILEQGLQRVMDALEKRAKEHKDTLCIGRSHGIHGEPTTFGLKLAGHYAAFKRCLKRLQDAREEISVCAISGAVGTYATVDPAVEAHVAEKMGLKGEDVSTQVIPRDRHAVFFTTLGIIASVIENFAVEIRHLQRTEVREAEEYFSDKQKGSSAMPHKRNPILTENLTGLARLVRSAVTPALENVALWHERDISHSSVERGIAPDACVTLDFALQRLAGMIEKLTVMPHNMMRNMERTGGLVFSQRVLLALTQSGISREDGYRIVQRNAMKVWESEGETKFLDLLKQDDDVRAKMNEAELEAIFDYSYYTKHINTVFQRVFG
jgi:adenylosuccinate lyase